MTRLIILLKKNPIWEHFNSAGLKAESNDEKNPSKTYGCLISADISRYLAAILFVKIRNIILL